MFVSRHAIKVAVAPVLLPDDEKNQVYAGFCCASRNRNRTRSKFISPRATYLADSPVSIRDAQQNLRRPPFPRSPTLGRSWDIALKVLPQQCRIPVDRKNKKLLHDFAALSAMPQWESYVTLRGLW
jgi:hypothetical protein